MPLRFSLDSVLRLRRSEQRQQELLLQKANDQVHRVLRELEVIAREVLQIVADGKSAGGITGAEIQFDQLRRQVLETRQAQAGQGLQQAREEQTMAASDFKRAWQRREALETLRELERQIYLLAESPGTQRW